MSGPFKEPKMIKNSKKWIYIDPNSFCLNIIYKHVILQSQLILFEYMDNVT